MHGASRVNNNKRHDNELILWNDWPTKKRCAFIVIGTIIMGYYNRKSSKLFKRQPHKMVKQTQTTRW